MFKNTIFLLIENNAFVVVFISLMIVCKLLSHTLLNTIILDKNIGLKYNNHKL